MANKPLKTMRFPNLPDTYVAVPTGSNGQLVGIGENNIPQAVSCDAAPVSGSSNPVESNGIYELGQDLWNKILDSYPTKTIGPESIISVDDGADGIPIKSLLVTVEPIQSGSGDPSPTNVRTISGWNAVNVSRTGTNVWDEQWEVGNYSSTTGEKISSTARIRCKNPIQVKPSTAYYFVAPAGTRNQWFEYGVDGSFLSVHNFSGGNFTVGANTYFITFTMTIDYGTAYNNDISVNYPATDTEYHAYRGNTFTFPFTSAVYGGTFTLTYYGKWMASMVVDRKAIDLETVNWPDEQTSWGGWASPVQSDLAGLPGPDNIMCDRYKPLGYSQVRNGATPSIAVGQSSDPKKLYVRTGSTAKPEGILVAPLANPTTITWTQLQLLEILGENGFMTLLGNNNAWTDAGDSTLVYRQDINILIDRLLNN